MVVSVPVVYLYDCVVGRELQLTADAQHHESSVLDQISPAQEKVKIQNLKCSFN